MLDHWWKNSAPRLTPDKADRDHLPPEPFQLCHLAVGASRGLIYNPQLPHPELPPPSARVWYLHFQLFDPEQRIDSKYESNSPLMHAQRLAGEKPCQPVAYKARAFFTPVCKDKWACHKQS